MGSKVKLRDGQRCGLPGCRVAGLPGAECLDAATCRYRIVATAQDVLNVERRPVHSESIRIRVHQSMSNRTTTQPKWTGSATTWTNPENPSKNHSAILTAALPDRFSKRNERPFARRYACFMKRLLFALLFTFTAAAQTPDPIEGKWHGVAGFPHDRVEINFEFKRNAAGELRAYLYQSVMNFYGLDAGLVKRDGDAYTVEDMLLNVTMKDGALEGTYFSLKAPIALQRTETLPSEVPIPEFSRPKPLWQTKLGAAIYAPAAIRDGAAYVGTSGGMFYSVSLDDGRFLWAFNAGRGIYGQALTTADALFFTCDNGYLYKLERKTGKELWKYDLGDSRTSRVLPHQVLPNSGDFDFHITASQPLLADGVLYAGSGEGLHAVNPATGQRIWHFAAGVIRTNPAIDEKHLYVGTLGDFVYAVDRKSGAKVWEKNTYGPLTSSPVLIGDKLIIGNRNGLLAALDPATGTVQWRLTFWGSAIESTPTPAGDGLFYIGSSDLRRVSLIDSKDARVLWRTDVYGWSWPRPAVTSKHVYAAAMDMIPYQMRHEGGLTALHRETGKVVWRYTLPPWPGLLVNGFGASPVVEGKVLVAGGLDGSLYAFGAE